MTLPSLADAPAYYAELGYDTVPLTPGGKDAAHKDWPRRAPAEQWATAPADSNVAIRGAGEAQAAVFDCDEHKKPGALATIQNFLWGLGYEPGTYPVVRTANNGGHLYVSLAGELPGDVRKLAAKVGAGEFRYGPAALTAAPPSQVVGRRYVLEAGDFRSPARVTVAEVLPLLGNKSLEASHRPRVPARAWALLQGKGTDRYSSRSEAEQAIVAMLVNAGFEFADVARFFQSYPAAGKFAELNARGSLAGLRWLRLSYGKAEEWAKATESEGRALARAALAWGQTRAWPGRTGSVDRAVFLAHAQIAYRAGRYTYGAACRELAELAGVNHMTASNATRRLLRAAFVALHEAATVSRPSVYRLVVPNVATFAARAERTNLYTPSIVHVRECISLSVPDAFRAGGLGMAAGEVWTALQDAPQTTAQLAAATGRPVWTVRRALRRMARIVDPATGEILASLALVQADGRQWRAMPNVDLDRVALVLGTAGKGKRQKQKHMAERRSHQKALQRAPSGDSANL